ncbi:MAG TPA: MHYT domain-containing protein, partial [Candidatus Cybelea sp.]|nr:MHYT domain-containing protein [Candidatus Cybelea sp.]
MDTALFVTYDPLMVAASVVVAIMASFTGLRLASGLRSLEPGRRKLQIAKAALTLGGGIWSMHFVAMLALRLQVAIGYDALHTLGSALIAILITGLGLSLMFVGERTLARTVMAGTLTGLGIVCMHYFGMSAITGSCQVSYVPAGFAISTTIAILFSICALRLAYGRRTLVQLSLGAAVLGVTISGMHYSAMAFTRFFETANTAQLAAPVIQDGYLALIVALAAFVVCGLFLLTALPLEATRQSSS